MTITNPLDWEYHQVDHLFLLIGENPLPNYVAAKTLLKEGGKPCLVYTQYTQYAAKKLQEILRIDENDKVELYNHETNAFEIKKAIKDKVEEIQKQNIQQKKVPSEIRFGLNYTGGTKAMAVHAYQTLLESKISTEPIFSYLDPRELEMLIDQKNDSPIKLSILNAKIKHKLDISFKVLFELHDLRWKEKEEPVFKPILYSAANEILTLYQQHRKEVANSYFEWCKNKLCQAKRDENYDGYWKDESDLENIQLDISTVPIKIKKVFQKYMETSGDKLNMITAKNSEFSRFKDFCGWLNCGWLEHYVLWHVQDISTSLDIDESAMSFHIEDPENRNSDWDKFEFDVAFRRRYQLFALSCTTASRDNVCKAKLFEAYVRARQLGGAESRVALVCLHKDPKRLEKQMKILIQDSKIAVFGHTHLKNLSKSITKWVQGKDY